MSGRLARLSEAQRLVLEGVHQRQGRFAAGRLLEAWRGHRGETLPAGRSSDVPGRPLSAPPDRSAQTCQNHPQEHPSHRRASEILEPHREALGAAYATLHAVARLAVEHATPTDPAPHLMSTYWTLEEITGKSERTLRRHLVEDGHPWSETVRHFLDTRVCYGELLAGTDERGRPRTRSAVVATVFRFFPEGRYSHRAVVKRWGRRDLLADSDEGRTRPTRPIIRNARYSRESSRMSAYRSATDQAQQNNWLVTKLGQTVTERSENLNPGSLYADIPRSHLLHVLREDLRLTESLAIERGASVARARARWAGAAGAALAARLGEDRPAGGFVELGEGDLLDAPEGCVGYVLSDRGAHPVFASGWTNLWRRAVWTALKAELFGGTGRGWVLLQHAVELAGEGRRLGLDRPAAWAYSRVRDELGHLRRDYSSGCAGAAPG